MVLGLTAGRGGFGTGETVMTIGGLGLGNGEVIQPYPLDPNTVAVDQSTQGVPVVTSAIVSYCQPGQVLNGDGSACVEPSTVPAWFTLLAVGVGILFIVKRGGR